MVVVHGYAEIVDKENIRPGIDDVVEDVVAEKEALDREFKPQILPAPVEDPLNPKKLLAVVRPPFLHRNHIGYKSTIPALKVGSIREKMIVLGRLRKPKVKERRSHSQCQKELEACMVDLKRNHLLKCLLDENESRSSELIVLEFFNFMNVVGSFSADASVDATIRVIGTDDDGNFTGYAEEIFRIVRSPAEALKKATDVVEYNLPKLRPDLTQLFLVAEARFKPFVKPEKPTEMRNRRGKRSRTGVLKELDHDASPSTSTPSSSSSSTSGEFMHIGAVKIADISKKDPDDWDVKYKNRGLTLLSESSITEDDLTTPENMNLKVAKIAEECKKVYRKGPNPTLSFEISNEHGYGTFVDDEIKSQMTTRRSQRRKRNVKPGLVANRERCSENVEVLYNLKALADADMKILVARGLVLPVAYKKRKDSHWLMRLDTASNTDRNLRAHKAGSRLYHCLFCVKAFPDYENLQLHLEHSYPSFKFDYTPGQIDVSVDESKLADEASISFSMIKSRVSSVDSDSGRGSMATDISEVRQRRRELPYERCWDTAQMYTVNADPSRTGHEMNTSFISEIFAHELGDFTDVDRREARFFHMWNMFCHTERKNRTKGICLMYWKLYEFVKLNHAEMREQGLQAAFLTFLTTLRQWNYVNEVEFLTLITYGSDLQDNWYGRSEYIAEKEQEALLLKEKKKRRGRKKKGYLARSKLK